MEYGTLRGIGTAVLFLAFVALCVWAWWPSQRRGFDEAAALPFLDETDGAGKEAKR